MFSLLGVRARAAETTAVLNRPTSLAVTKQLVPQVRHNRRAVPTSGVSARIGTRGLSRAVSAAVVPEWVKQQIALISVVSAISRAAATIPSATLERLAVRLASICSV